MISMGGPRVNVSILLYAENAEKLRNCLASIHLHTLFPYELIVVAGAKEAEVLNEYEGFPGLIRLDHLHVLGKARALNAAAEQATGRFFAFLSDAVEVTPGWLEDLTGFLDRELSADAVGPLIGNIEGPQRLEYADPDSFLIVSRALRALRSRGAQPADRLENHVLVVRRNSFWNAGGFSPDSSFLSESLEQAGMKLQVLADCAVRYQEDAEASENKRPTLGLCLIVKNEERTLARCLSSAAGIVDEIVVVDTGSMDRTVEIARTFTDNVFRFEWVNDFSKARNYAFEQVASDYIFWMDADDVLLEKDAEQLSRTLATMPSDTDAVSMPYHLAFDEAGNVASSLRRNRIVKKARDFRWIGQVHEYLAVSGNIHESEAAITHRREHEDSDRNLKIYERKEETGETFTARDLYYYANELREHRLWERAVQNYERFLERDDGWIEDRLAAYGHLADIYQEAGDVAKAKRTVLEAFNHAAPRAENCCRLGYYHISEQDYAGAVSWYQMALHTLPPDTTALENKSCRTWLPHLQLCVCYDRLQQTSQAMFHNEEAAAYVPDHESVIGNRRYFIEKAKIPSFS